MSAAKAKGTRGETEVVRYLRQWWPQAERRALSGSEDRGDVAGIPGLVVEVKAAQRQMLAAWQRETLKEMENAGATACVLVVKRPYKPVARWDAYMPASLVPAALRQVREGDDLWGWVRMDFLLAIAILKDDGY